MLRLCNHFTAVITGMILFLCDNIAVHGDVNRRRTSILRLLSSSAACRTRVANIVTGLLADYRGFDTMWETTVMFLAGLTVVMLLSSSTMGRRPEKEDEDA